MSVIDEFCEQHFALQGTLPQRRADLIRELTRYQEWLGDLPIERAGGPELERYMVYMITVMGFKPSTAANYVFSRLKPFYNWLWRQGRIDAETLLRLRAVKAPRGSTTYEPRPYSRKEIAELHAAVAKRFRLKSDLSIRRWRNGTSSWGKVSMHAHRLQIGAIISLALVCGLRRHEIFQLSLDDLHPDNGHIPIRGKGDKLRIVAYVDHARDPVARWLQFRRWIAPKHDSPWLCLHGVRHHDPMSYGAFQGLLRRIGDGYELHRLRHTCATEWLRTGKIPIERLQRFMGHSDIRQTLAYAKIVDQDIEESFEAAAPHFRAAA